MSESKAVNMNKYKFCFCFRIIFKDRLLEPPQDVKDLFEQYSQNDTMTLEDHLRFLVEEQGEKDAKLEDARTIFNSLRHFNIFQRKGLHLEAFFRYLIGDLNFVLSTSPKVYDFNYHFLVFLKKLFNPLCLLIAINMYVAFESRSPRT